MPGTLLYLDSSALVKLVVTEPESAALLCLLPDWPERVSSVLAAVELPRAVRRMTAGSGAARARVAQVLAAVNLLPLDDRVVALAAEAGPHELRSLDAIHLASALSLGADLGAVACYDRRLAEAVENAGRVLLAPR